MIFKVLLAELLYRPIYNILLVFLFLFDGSLGIAIILLTLFIRLILIKVTAKSNNMHQGMGDYHKKMSSIQEKHKDNPEKQAEEMMKGLKNGGAGPLKGCLMLLIQIPVFITLYWVVRKIANNEIPMEWMYSFMRGIGHQYTDLTNVNTTFLGMDLLKEGNLILTIISAVFVYAQTKLTMMIKPKQEQSQLPGGQKMPDMNKMMGGMSIFMVLIMGFFVYTMPAAIGLYIITTTVFSVGQYMVQYREVLSAKWQALFRSKNKPVIVDKK